MLSVLGISETLFCRIWGGNVKLATYVALELLCTVARKLPAHVSPRAPVQLTSWTSKHLVAVHSYCSCSDQVVMARMYHQFTTFSKFKQQPYFPSHFHVCIHVAYPHLLCASLSSTAAGHARRLWRERWARQDMGVTWV